MRISSPRRASFDELGLRRALSDRTMTMVIAAMAFLAGLAVAGWIGAEQLASQWRGQAGATLTVQVPDPSAPDASGSGPRLKAVRDLLVAAPNVAEVKVLSNDQISAMLRPWLGTDLNTLAVPVPAVLAVRLRGDAAGVTDLAGQLRDKAPGTILEDHAAWTTGLETLAWNLRLSAGAVLFLVVLVTAMVVAGATRSGLSARREAIAIVSQLGATDGYIVRRFAARAAVLALIGGLIGGLIALPAVFGLAWVAAPLAGASPPITPEAALTYLPWPLWLLPVALPLAAAAIGFLTTQIALRPWLRRLP